MKGPWRWTKPALLIAATALLGCTWQDGALVGSAIGAGTGAIIGHQTGHAGGGAAIGAGLGALSGGLIGKAIEDTETTTTVSCPPPPRKVIVRHSHMKRVPTLVGYREREVQERVWVPARYEEVELRGYDSHGNEIIERRPVLVEPGHWEYHTRVVREPIYKQMEVCVVH